MDYHIKVKNSLGLWEFIASFENMVDREDCLKFLQGKYNDLKMKAKDDE